MPRFIPPRLINRGLNPPRLNRGGMNQFRQIIYHFTPKFYKSSVSLDNDTCHLVIYKLNRTLPNTQFTSVLRYEKHFIVEVRYMQAIVGNESYTFVQNFRSVWTSCSSPTDVRGTSVCKYYAS